MFDLGIGELLIVGVVALIVIGPKDLPGMFRTLGQFTAKLKRLAREFRTAMEDAADDAGVKEAGDMMKSATNPSNMGLNKLNDAAKKFDEWDPTKPSETSKGIGSETAKMSEERAEAARKIREYSTQKAGEKRAAEAAEAAAKAEAKVDAKPEPKPEGDA